MTRFADFAKTFVGQQRVERRGEEVMVDETAVVHMPFVKDHPQELAAFAISHRRWRGWHAASLFACCCLGRSGYKRHF